jgi:hypothetical protein
MRLKRNRSLDFGDTLRAKLPEAIRPVLAQSAELSSRRRTLGQPALARRPRRGRHGRIPGELDAPEPPGPPCADPPSRCCAAAAP